MSTGRIVRTEETAIPHGLPELGRVKVGEKALSQGGKEYPTSLDYFRFTGKYAAIATEKLGEKPTQIPIVFITDNVGECCKEEWASWDGGKRNGSGDGVNFNVFDPAQKKYVEAKRGTPEGDRLFKLYKWETWLTLRFVIPAIDSVLGHWVFATKGVKTSQKNIIGTFDLIQKQAGTVVGFPFELVVDKVTGYSPGESRKYPVVKLVPQIGAAGMETMHKLNEAGRSVTGFAGLVFTEATLKQIREQFDEAVIVEDTKQLNAPTPAVAEPATEAKPGTIAPNPKVTVDEKGQAGMNL